MAARELNVAPELINGLCRSGKLEAIKTTAKNGHTVFWLIRKSAVQDLKAQLRKA
jgi:hypothetical protein